MNTLNTNKIAKWLKSAVFSATIIVLLFPGVIYGAGDDFFLRQDIDISGTILGAREADLDGDGRTDLILLVSDPSGVRTLRSYIQRESGRFPPTAGQILEISSSANMVQCLDLDDNGRMELYYIDNQGMWSYVYNGDEFAGTPKAAISIPTLFVGGIEGGLLSQPCIHTLSGRAVAFIPVANGYSLWEYNDDKFRNIGMLNVPHLLVTSPRPVKLFSGLNHDPQECFQINIPAVVIGDQNGDERDDIYLIWSDRISILTQLEDGRFDSQNMIHFHFQDPQEGNLCQARLIDFDRDGRLDVVCSRSGGGISGAQTDINFFHSTQIRRQDRAESYTISLTDVCGNLMLDDFDGNGSQELVVPAVELGIMSTVKKMITKKTDFHILVYPIDNLGRPANEPKVRKKISCSLDFENADPTALIRIDWTGDYDGDGMADLVVADGAGQLLFYRGTAEEYLENKANLVLDMDSPDEIRPVHLNNDGRSDLLIIHKQLEGIMRLTLLVTNSVG